MSYVSVFVVRKSGLVERVGEARNNHGYAPQVWEHLAIKYKVVGPEVLYLMGDEAALKKLWAMFKPLPPVSLVQDEDFFIPRFNSPVSPVPTPAQEAEDMEYFRRRVVAALGVPPELLGRTPTQLDALDNILLGSTFDRVWIKKERLPLLFKAIQRFTADWIVPKVRVQTALECIPIIKDALEKDPEAVGICFNQCSAISPYWYKQIPIGADGTPLVGNGAPVDWDTAPLNIFTDKHNGREEQGYHWEIGEVEHT